jgi:hypothetical protein
MLTAWPSLARFTTGRFTDPVSQSPKNPYFTALNNQRWLWVRAKAQVKDGNVKKNALNVDQTFHTKPAA